jgi:hypothetical protein
VARHFCFARPAKPLARAFIGQLALRSARSQTTSGGRVLVDVLDCLKKYGQRLDLEIAKETGVPLDAVRERLAALCGRPVR